MITKLDVVKLIGKPRHLLLLAVFALAARYDWEIKQGDVTTAFLSSDMDCDLWAAVLNWFDVDSSEFEREDMSEARWHCG